MAEHQEIEYDNTLIAMLELIWGEGFLSPGKRSLTSVAESAESMCCWCVSMVPLV